MSILDLIRRFVAGYRRPAHRGGLPGHAWLVITSGQPEAIRN
jgi:hypothetical protein